MPLTAQQLFDFESIFESAIAAALNDAGFPAVRTTATAKQFQEVRPRLELLFKVENEKTPVQLAPDSAGQLRATLYSGSVLLALITAANPTGKLTHAAYRAQLRAALGLNLLPSVNNINGRLVNHRLNFIRQTATEYEFDPDAGYEKTAHNYAVDFSIYPPSLAQFP